MSRDKQLERAGVVSRRQPAAELRARGIDPRAHARIVEPARAFGPRDLSAERQQQQRRCRRPRPRAPRAHAAAPRERRRRRAARRRVDARRDRTAARPGLAPDSAGTPADRAAAARLASDAYRACRSAPAATARSACAAHRRPRCSARSARCRASPRARRRSSLKIVRHSGHCVYMAHSTVARATELDDASVVFALFSRRVAHRLRPTVSVCGSKPFCSDGLTMRKYGETSKSRGA